MKDESRNWNDYKDLESHDKMNSSNTNAPDSTKYESKYDTRSKFNLGDEANGTNMNSQESVFDQKKRSNHSEYNDKVFKGNNKIKVVKKNNAHK